MKDIFDITYDIDNMYVAQFSDVFKREYGDIYFDKYHKEKYLNNYLSLKSSFSEKDLLSYISECKRDSLSFAQFKIKGAPGEEFKALGDVDDTHIITMLAERGEIRGISKRDDCSIVNAKDDPDEFLKALYLDSLIYGERYSSQNASRYYDVIIEGDSKISYYMLKHGDIILGYASAFLSGDYLKIEDFCISKPYQRKGFGSSLFKMILERYDFKYVYVLAQMDDTPKDMYEKWGFKIVGEAHLIRKSLKKR